MNLEKGTKVASKVAHGALNFFTPVVGETLTFLKNKKVSPLSDDFLKRELAKYSAIAGAAGMGCMGLTMGALELFAKDKSSMAFDTFGGDAIGQAAVFLLASMVFGMAARAAVTYLILNTKQRNVSGGELTEESDEQVLQALQAASALRGERAVGYGLFGGSWADLKSLFHQKSASEDIDMDDFQTSETTAPTPTSMVQDGHELSVSSSTPTTSF